MQHIRCTAKLQKEMGLKKTDLSNNVIQEHRLGQWHANIIYIDRKKSVLFVNDKTLFNFVAPDLRRANIRKLADVFRSLLSCVLHDEGYSNEIVETVLGEYSDIRYSKTNSRSVLGNLNDLAFHYEYHIRQEGGVHSPAVPAIIKQMNRMPMRSQGKLLFSADALKKLLMQSDVG